MRKEMTRNSLVASSYTSKALKIMLILAVFVLLAAQITADPDIQAHWPSKDEGLIAEWQLEGNSTNSTFPDNTKNKYDCTCTGTRCPDFKYDGAIGGAFDFDGYDDALECEMPYMFENVSKNDFSIELWTKFDAFHPSGWTRMFVADSNLTTSTHIFVHYPTHRIKFNVRELGMPQVAIQSNTIATTGVWYHVVATWDASSSYGRLYIDGVDRSSGSGSSIAVYSNKKRVCIGARTYGASGDCISARHNGSIDEVRVYGRVLTADEVARHYELESDSFHAVTNADLSVNGNETYSGKQIVDWRLDGDSMAVVNVPFEDDGADNTTDYSTNGNTLTTYANVAYQSTGCVDQGGCYYFPNNDASYLADASVSGLPSGDVPKSISAWFRTSSCTVADTIGGFGSTGAGENFQIELCEGGGDLFTILGGTAPYNWDTGVSSAAYLDDAWHHISVTYNGDSTRLYVDTELIASTTDYSWNTDPQRVVVGQEIDYAGRSFSGYIDEFMIFDRALTHKQIKKMYETSGVWSTIVEEEIGEKELWTAEVTYGSHFYSVSAGGQACTVPSDDIVIKEDSTLCEGDYNFADNGGLGVFRFGADNLKLTCTNTKVYGTGSGVGVYTSYSNTTIEGCEFEDYSSAALVGGLWDEDYTYGMATVPWTGIVDSEDYVILPATDLVGDQLRFIKIDQSGSVEWTTTMVLSSKDIATGSDVDFHDNIYTLTYDDDDYDFYIVKVDSDGNHIWNDSYLCAGTTCYSRGLAVDTHNDAVGVGYDYTGGVKWVVMKWYENGTSAWNNIYSWDTGSSYNYAMDVDTDSSDNIVVVGHVNSSGQYNWKLLKLNSTGGHLWNLTVDWGSSAYMSGVVIDSSDDVVVLGSIGSSYSNNFTVAKYDSDGDPFWTVTLDYGALHYDYDITVDSEDNILAVVQENSSGTYDWRVTKIDPFGSVLWNRTIITSASSGDEPVSVDVDSTDNIILMGSDSPSGWGSKVVRLNGDGEIQVNGTTFFRSSFGNSSIGIDFDGGVYDSVMYQNNIFGNGYGVYLPNSAFDNIFYLNEFENSTTNQAYAGAAGNYFNKTGAEWDVYADLEQDTSLSNADASFYGEVVDDLTGGYALDGIGDVNGDGYDDFMIGSSVNDEAGTWTGQSYLIFGRESGWSMDVNLSDANASFRGEHSYQNSGSAVAGVGDVNGDGFDDFIIGAYRDDEGDSETGQAYLFFGKAGGWSMDTSVNDADASFVGKAPWEQAGRTAAGAGDVNGDGYDDFLIGPGSNGFSGGEAGHIYLILGKSNGWTNNVNFSDADAGFYVEDDPDDIAGLYPSGAGDINGDGYDDILIGVPNNDDAGSSSGQVYIIFGRSSGWSTYVNLSDSNASYRGELGNDNAGSSVAIAGDVNKDGYDDMIIGAKSRSEGGGSGTGHVYLIFGRSSGWSMDMSLSTANASYLGEDFGDNLGSSVDGVGDVDGDGYADFLMGALYNDEGPSFQAGQTYLILGKNSGWSMDTSLSYADATFIGEAGSDRAGGAVASAGDVDDDGFADLLICARGSDEHGDDTGQTYLILGGTNISGNAGNRWDDTIKNQLLIFDSDNDLFGDFGPNWEYSLANGGQVSSNVYDYRPMLNDNDLDGDPDWRDCDDNNASVLSPRDDLIINKSMVLCGGTYYLNDTSEDGLIVFGAENVTLTCNGTVMIGNGSGYGIYTDDYDGVNIIGCNVSSYGYGIYSYFSVGSSISFVNAYNNVYGVFTYSSYNSSVSNINGMDNSQHGVFMQFSGNSNLSDVNTWNNSQIGVYLYYSDNSGVWEVNSSDNSQHGLYLRSSENVTLENVSAWNNSQNGFYVRYSENTTIDKSFIWNNTLSGIYFSYSGNSLIRNMSVWDNLEHGVGFFHSENSTVRELVAWNNTDNGIEFDRSSNFSIYNSSLIDNDYGLRGYMSENSIISDVVARGNDQGIRLYHSYNSSVGNVLAWDNTYGIYMRNSENSSVFNSETWDNSNSGVLFMYSNTSRIWNVSSWDNDFHGLYFYHSHESDAWNITSSNNTQYGLYVYYSPQSLVNDVDVLGNTQYGMYVSYSENSNISKINSRNNGDEGVYLYYSENSSVWDVNSWNNSGHGLFIRQSGNSNAWNISSLNNTGIGIYIYRSDYPTILNVTSADNTLSGIRFTEASWGSLSNSLSETSEEGLYIRESDGLIVTNNTFLDNNYGVYVFDSGSDGNLLYWNNFTDNSILQVYSISGADNYFNTSVGGIAQGNYWDDVERNHMMIVDVNLDGWGDSGTEYPYNSSNGGDLDAGVQDFGPVMTDADGDGDPDWRDCDDTNISILSPYDDLVINRTIMLCNGSFYVEDVASDGMLKFGADEVQLTCNKTEIIGDDTGYGLYSNSYTWINITGCTITNYSRGMGLQASHNGTVWNMTFVDNDNTGLSLFGSDDLNLWNISARDNNYGVRFLSANNARVSDIYAWDNSIGIGFGDVLYSELYDINVWSNSQGMLFTDSTDSDMWDSSSVNNTQHGIWLDNSDNLNITNVISLDNTYSGLYLYQSDNSTISSSSFSRNSDGILLRVSFYNRFINNTLSFNEYGANLYDASTDNNLFYWNNFSNNSVAHAIAVSGSASYWNTSILGVAQGNIWDDITNFEIYDTTGNMWADSGEEIPYREAIGANVTGEVYDYAPRTTRFVNCTIINSSIRGSNITWQPYYERRCYVEDSSVQNSNITNAVFLRSFVNRSNIIDSHVENSSFNESYVEYSTVLNSIFCGIFDVFSAGITDGHLDTGRVKFNSTDYYPPAFLEDICGEYVPPYDPTAPTAPTVYDGISGDDTDWISDNTSLSAHWFGAGEDMSTIYYKFMIYANTTCLPGYCGWTDVRTNTSVSVDGLALYEGTNYSFNVIAYNAYGLNSSNVSSDGVYLDLSEPYAPTITSPTHPVQNQTYINSTAIFRWNSTDSNASIAYSGILGYSFLLNKDEGTSPDDILEAIPKITLQEMPEASEGLIIKDNLTGEGKAVFVEILDNVSVGDTINLKFELSERLSETVDDMEYLVYAIKKTSIANEFNFEYNETDELVSNLVAAEEDISYTSTVADAYIYSAKLTMTESVNSSSGNVLYIAISGVRADDDNENELALSFTSIPDNSTKCFVCNESAANCDDMTNSLDVALEVKKTTAGNIVEKQYNGLADGTYWFHVKAQDYAGNFGNVSHYRINIYSGEPVVEIIEPFNGQVFSEDEINVTVGVDINSSVYVYVQHPDGSNYTSLVQNFTVSDVFENVELEYGTNTIQAFAVSNISIRGSSEKIYVIYGEQGETDKTLLVTYTIGGTVDAPHLISRDAGDYNIGFGTENTGAVLTTTSIQSNTSFYTTKIFMTTDEMNEQDAFDLLQADSLLDKIEPSFGYEESPTGYIIASELRYPTYILTGPENVTYGAGKYAIILKYEGLTEDGDVDISARIQ